MRVIEPTLIPPSSNFSKIDSFCPNPMTSEDSSTVLREEVDPTYTLVEPSRPSAIVFASRRATLTVACNVSGSKGLEM